MTRRTQRRAISLILATFVASTQVTPAAHADPRPGQTEDHEDARVASHVEAWQQSTSVRLQPDGSLTDVLAISPADVWAVGQQEIWDVWKNRGTIRHWDGARWAEVGVRDDTASGGLRGLAAASASDVWAVGDGHDGLPYLAQGDISGFDRVRPQGLRAGDWLGGIDAKSGKVVAVGSREKNGLILTGQGNSWTVEQTEEKGALYAVDDGFAVGDTGTEPLIMHNSGGSWKSMPVPEIPGGYLRDVKVDNSKRALAVGGVYRGPGDTSPLALAWNGRRWRQLKLPGEKSRLFGVTGDGKGRFWMTGYDPSHPEEPFMTRCEKGRCEIIRGSAQQGRSSIRLQAVTYLAGKSMVWAVGHAVDAAERFTDVVETFAPKAVTEKS